jgi:hypothetical protein
MGSGFQWFELWSAIQVKERGVVTYAVDRLRPGRYMVTELMRRRDQSQDLQVYQFFEHPLQAKGVPKFMGCRLPDSCGVFAAAVRFAAFFSAHT